MKIDLNDKVVRFLVQEYVNQIYHYSNEKDLNYNLHKLIHTFQVVEMAQKLINNTKPALQQNVKTHILNAAVLHDIGRCHEFKFGKKISVDHGKLGSKLIEKNFPYMKVEAKTTFFHNKLPSDKDPKDCQPILDYVRDADMLANIRYEIEETDMWLIHILGSNKKSLLTPIIDKEILKAAQEMRPAKIVKIKTKNLLTLWLWQLCWIFNLRTKAGFHLNKKEKIFIRFKKTIIKKIIPLTTRDKKEQKVLSQKIQEMFPDRLLLK